jgi:hypothetical protein
MYQLNTIDYEFYKDIDSHNSVVGNIAILNNEDNKNIKAKIIENIKKNIGSSIIHSHKIVLNPIVGDYPFLIKDKNLNLDNHVFEHQCNGSVDEADQIFKNIISSPLNPNIPLWQTDIVYNVNEQRNTAIIRRYHHCLGDSDAHENVHNLLFDNYDKPKVKQQKRVNKTNSYINHFYKIIKSYLLLTYGFVLKTNKCTKNYKIDKKEIHKGIFRAKRHKINTVSFFSYDISNIEKILKDNQISKLELCIYGASYVYKKLLNDTENKTIVSMFPITYRNSKHSNCNNMATAARINFHLNEENNFKRLLIIKQEIKDKIKTIKDGPHKIYDKAFVLDPRINKFKRNWDIFNKADWHNRKKIYTKDNNPPSISTTTSFRHGDLQTYSVDSLRIKNVYNFSMISKTISSLGCSISYRCYGNKINVGIIYSADLYPDSSLFELYFKESIEDLEKTLKLQ